MKSKDNKILERVTIRFAGDSGDGIQLSGQQFTNTTALAGNDLSTLPDFPAEIRAPAGTLFGVSGFQIQFSSEDIYTPGDQADVLIAFNPAALKASIGGLKHNGILIANSDAFKPRNLKLAGFDHNPLDNGDLKAYQVFSVPITKLTREALQEIDLTSKEKDHSKNFFALGITYWMYSRSLQSTMQWIDKKFQFNEDILEANKLALNAGYNYALSTELFATAYTVHEVKRTPGKYRNINGNEALALGLIAGAYKADKSLFLGAYPITPASDMLHILSRYKNYGVKTFQAEDEIAGIGAALGASFAGDIGVTATSGPGFTLKSEFIDLAVITELPLVVIDIQRAGPSTGMPTKTEQSDLLQALYGRHGEAPVAIVAPNSPADCFNVAFGAIQTALEFNVPVIILSDGNIANGSEPWLIPNTNQLPEIKVEYATKPDEYKPYKRNKATLARQMAIPGMKGFEHRIGGLEKDEKGNVSYDAENHDRMVELRAEKIDRIRPFIKEPELTGLKKGELIIVSWGSTYGPIYTAIEELENQNIKPSWLHLRWLNPMPQILDKVIKNFKKVLVIENNKGQLLRIIRSEYLVDAKGFNKVTGLPFKSIEIVQIVKTLTEN
ncbi:MAG: 2-oxoacid:acceptor oxidoreductase subunit alpha [Calditrichaceae bacterium]